MMEADNRRSFLSSVLGAGAYLCATLTSSQSALARPVKRIKNAPLVILPSGVQYQEMSIGDGPSPQLGDRVAVHYSLYYNGMEIESSRESSGLAARPFGFTFGAPAGPGAIPKGLEQAIKGMQVGGRRKIYLPPDLAYGSQGRVPFIPPGATVMFDVSLWSVKPAGTNPNLTRPGQSNIF